MSGRTAVAVAVLALAARAAGAGDQGQIAGSVADPSGAILADAAVVARHRGTGALLGATTDGRGVFLLPAVSIGAWDVTAGKPPFAPAACRGVQVTVGARIDLVLVLGAPSLAEEVAVEAPRTETTRSQVSTTVDARSIAGLPVSARNVLDFILLAPGVTRDARLGDLSFAGQRAMNMLLVDGGDDTNSFFAQALGRTGSGRAPYQLSIESVAEFQVSTASYAAELGRAGGGVVNLVTRSGTNDLHGAAFWNYRDRALEAKDLIARLSGQPKPPDHFNQFGAAVGGPIARDRLFFFVVYDAQRSRLPNPTSLNLPASFAFSADPSTAGYERRALEYLAPRARSWDRTFDQDVYFARLDWQPGPGRALSARANVQRFDGEGIESFGPQVSHEHTGAAQVLTDSITLSATLPAREGVVSVTRASFVRDHEPGFADGDNPEASVFEGGQLVLTVGRNPVSPRRQTIHRLHLAETVAAGHGAHALKAGAEVVVDRVGFFTAQNFSGVFRFNSLAGFGRSLAGSPQPAEGEFYRQGFAADGEAGVTVHPDSTDLGLFVQDDWRVRPSLTANLGLRYDVEWMSSPSARNRAPVLAAHGIDTGHIPFGPWGVAPRLGLAWTAPSRRLVVRAGYGIFRGRTPGLLISRPHFQNGVTIRTLTLTPGLGGSSIPAYPATLCGMSPASGAPPTCAPPAAGAGDTTLVLFAPGYRQPLVHQASAGVERAFAGGITASATCLGAFGRRLQRTRDVNLAPPVAAAIGIAGSPVLLQYRRFAEPRPVTGFDRIWEFESSARSSFHGLLLQVAKRAAGGTGFAAAYTLGKVVDDAPDFVVATPGQDDARMVSDPSDPGADRGPGIDDQRHRFVLSGTWVRGGWRLGGIFAASSGQPYSGMVGFDLNGDGNAANDRTPGESRNALTRPSVATLDLRLVRTVRFGRARALQLIVDAFNVLDRDNVTAVRTTEFARSTSPAACGAAGTPCLVRQDTGPSAFGTPVATSGPRALQLAARLEF